MRSPQVGRRAMRRGACQPCLAPRRQPRGSRLECTAPHRPRFAPMNAKAGPLSHVKVLDLSRILAAPWAGQILADLGAEVIKVERPGAGDDTRTWGPPFLKDAEGKDTKEAGYYLAVNRGKRSITVSLEKPEGQKIIKELAKRADIVLENYKAGTLARYGLDEASLRK